ncbi:hypothetical protein CVT25_006655 [Psilocybe cyanescens]|uniref:Cytochrome P450 n=1 Tax=Psilocybe cyanescens TaxID=93625 RepID=A0A409XTT0_PSICY|nr:hypothetical protein CVT25_006655 [Psilocybe cyanescens]
MSVMLTLVIATFLAYMGLPFLGNAFDFPTANIGSEYVQWGEKYNSDILHASAFGTHVVIINSQQIADELLDRRGAKYSDRPYFPTIDLTGMSSYNLGVMRYGETWRIGRKYATQAFRQAGSPPNNLSSIIVTSVHQVLKRILHSPDNLWDHSKMISISIAMSSMYGYDAESSKDPCVVAADEAFIINMELASPGGSAQGDARPSLVADLLERKNTVGVSEKEEVAVMTIAPTTYIGASDPTKSAIGTFIYLMVINPDIQSKAQAEIDRILESKRLPGYEDRPAMLYVEAIYRKVLRWKPPGSLGFPHAVTEDDFYDGYLIPKGATILSNIWLVILTGNFNGYEELIPTSTGR